MLWIGTGLICTQSYLFCPVGSDSTSLNSFHKALSIHENVIKGEKLKKHECKNLISDVIIHLFILVILKIEPC